jgi:hypothetical protein
MKFDVTIGNPPYLARTYFNFLTMGDAVSSKHTIMITPDSWTSNIDGLEDRLINFKLYKNVLHAFNNRVNCPMGVCYGIIGKNKIKNKPMIIIDKNKNIHKLQYNKEHALDIEVSILNKLKGVEYNPSGSGYRLLIYNRYRLCLKSRLPDVDAPHLSKSLIIIEPNSTYDVRGTFWSDFYIECENMDEVNNSISYIFNPLIEFFIIKNMMDTMIRGTLYFDKTKPYTFDELCEQYGLTDDEKQYLLNNYGIHKVDFKIQYK